MHYRTINRSLNNSFKIYRDKITCGYIRLRIGIAL